MKGKIEGSKKVLAEDGYDVYKAKNGKFYAVIRWSNRRSRFFDSLLDLQNYYKL